MNTSILSLIFKPNVTPNIASQSALAIFRLVVGLMMIHNGLDKLGNIESFAEAYVSYIGLPFPIFFSYVAAFTELIGAPLVAIGLFTRPAALGLFSTMLVAMYHHILVAGLSVAYLELSAIYAACFLFILVNGAGLFSIDALILNLFDNEALDHKAKQVMSLEKSYQASKSQKAQKVS
ncbi:DoxX family protein [Crocosphaera sp. Alani8]|uniref:DoxX family protein n=1 Tax=Crocosphaera sp. Alani8 TaxID=3038952 RepID=UPI00313DF59B